MDNRQPNNHTGPDRQLTRRERRESERQRMKENPGQGEKGTKRKKVIRRVLIVLTAVAVIAGVVWLIAFAPARPARERPGEAFPIQGQTHIAVGATHPAYNSNPPTSGPHYAQPARWGVYQSELPDEQLVHNLEHGGIWISYKDIDDTIISSLEKIATSQPKIILEPRSKNDAPIVLASWGRLQKFQTYDEQGILAFIEANRNQSPEPLAQ